MIFTQTKLLALITLLFTFAAGGSAQHSDQGGRHEERSSISPSAVFTGAGTGPIPDTTGGPANWGVPLNVTFDVTGVVGPIHNVVLSITMNHTYIGDLDAVLIAPNGQTSTVIFSRVGATTAGSPGDSSDLGGTYTFADYATAANPWTVATDPACAETCIVTPRDYRTTIPGPTANPAQMGSLRNAFSSVAFPNGIWTLRLRDGTVSDVGAVTAASLTVESFFSRTPFDFDGDDRTDVGIFRPGAGEWWINRSSNGTTYALQFGTSSDVPAPGDFTGDGRTDVTIWRPSNGTWYVLRSEDFSFYAFPFGQAGDIPVTADYDDDGRDDAAVFRPSSATWFLRQSSIGTVIQQFGSPGDIPVVGDYDLDGRANVAIFRPSVGEWWIKRLVSGSFAFQFGASGDKPVPGDYTGDGKTDVAIWRPSNGTWYVLRSENMSFFSVPFGTSGDLPAPGDYDGDRRFDPTVFRPSTGTWYSNRSTAGTQIMQFGVNGDRPIPNSFVP